MEIENYIASMPSTAMPTIDINVITKKESIEQIRYRFIGQVAITILAIGGSVYSLITSGEQINANTVSGAIISGAIMLHVKAPKLY
jgi:hypothetical protein